MAEKYLEAIIKTLADKHYQPLKMRQLARRMGVADSDYAAFRDAVKQLKDAGRVVYGPKNDLSLPPMPERVVGVYRANARGFGFITPEEPNAHGDLFVPEGDSLDAMTGDTVAARVIRGGKRSGKRVYRGVIVEILARGNNRFVGELNRSSDGDVWFVIPQGRGFSDPILIDDAGPAAREGVKVVVEIIHYPSGADLARGVIVEQLGMGGPADVETLGIIREHGLPEAFGDDATADARRALEAFDATGDPTREDFGDWTIVTIDPEDARDYDDAISIHRLDGGGRRLGVHIADVSHFVREETALGDEARERGNSVYFPRKVVPMLPEILSNGVCSLQEGQDRFVKSALIDYDADGRVTAARLANGVIRSSKRLTYRQAQGILDGKTGGYDRAVVDLVREMEPLARKIEARRRQEGMLHLDLPEVELVLSDAGEVVDVERADESYTHTIIEMFMVEANEAAARLLDRLDVPFLRRIHPERDAASDKHLAEFVRACGHKIGRDLSRRDIQDLIRRVRGRPESYAVNLALLKTFEQAEYSPMRIGHYALASECYCHFTSPIRRYPDLTVHRLIDAHLRGRLDPETVDPAETTSQGRHCSFTERRAERAERELRTLLVLIMLSDRVGEVLDGVVTGVTSFGLFVQSSTYLVEGLIRLEDLGDDWWEPDPPRGQVIAQRTGKRVRLGDLLTVRIVQVDLARREMDLAVVGEVGRRPTPGGKKAGKGDGKGGKGGGKARKGGGKGRKGGGKGRRGAKTGAKRPASAAGTKRRKDSSGRYRGA
ncbi:MAG: ribonuclease R [Planctomycetota bacterium]